MKWIYLDNNATTQPTREVVAAMREALEENWANPSSVHRFGQAARQRVELARAAVAELVHARPREILFTSGGTESNNLALRGVLSPASRVQSPKPSSEITRDDGQRTMDYGLGTLITSPVEHSAVREPAMALQEAGLRVEYLRVDHQGVIDADHLQSLLQEIIDGVTASAALSRTAPAPHSLGPILVSVQWANNETGVLQPIEQISHIVGQAKDAAKQAGHRMKVYFHVDATQAAGKMPLNVKTAEVDLATFSAHKFHGPKGIAALYVGTGVRVRAINRGGPQEREKRGGTENVPGIMGMGVAAEQAAGFVEDHNRLAELTALRDRFEQMLRQAVPNMVVNSGQASTGRLWNTSNLAFPGLEAEAILLGLSERGVCASAGAACSSGSLEPSPVLRAMGIADPVAHGSVRFSLSRYTTLDEIKEAARIIPAIVERLGRTMPMGV